MGLRPHEELSKEYRQVEAILNGGWGNSATQMSALRMGASIPGEKICCYGDLAVCIGRSPKSGRIVGSLVASYARRHPAWDHYRIVTKKTNRPGYEDLRNVA